MNKPRTALDYITAAKDVKQQTKAAKTAKFNQIRDNAPSKSAALSKMGQGFVGPVMMRLQYEGIVRNVLTEDPIASGDVPKYDVTDELGRAYFLDDYSGEAVISQYEGKRVMYTFRHLAAFATIQEQDLLELSIDMAEYAVNEAKQRIMEQEDGYLFSLLDVAVDNIDATHPDFAGLTSHKVTAAGGTFQPENFYAAAAISAQNRLDSTNILMNPADYFDMLNWDLTATSVNFKDQTFAGTPVTSFAGFNVFRSVMVEHGNAYVLPAADYLGRMPVRKSLTIEENPKLEAFSIGFILSEYINEIILNSNGIVKITKS